MARMGEGVGLDLSPAIDALLATAESRVSRFGTMRAKGAGDCKLSFADASIINPNVDDG